VFAGDRRRWLPDWLPATPRNGAHVVGLDDADLPTCAGKPERGLELHFTQHMDGARAVR
jgi:hypothetical protein